MCRWRSRTRRGRGMEAARALVERVGEHTYGVNTGFGRFVSESIPDDQVEELQLRLLRSHACGVGEPYPDEVVRAAMLLRANALAKGYSGARIETVELLIECLNRGVLPRVPARGSVGASGDLAPLAHLALPLVGEGQAWFDGTLLSGEEALAAAGLEPIRLAAKEGLSLINGTQFMAAMASLALVRANRLARTADLACALSLEALQGSQTSFHPAIHAGAAAARAARLRRERAAPARRLLDHRVAPLVRQGAGRVLAALRAAGARCEPGSARQRRDDGCDRAQRRDRQPARPRRRGDGRLERQLPRTAARVRARHARDGRRRAGEHLRAAGRTARQPVALRRAAAVPHPRGRPQLGLHDPPVRGGVARLREQVALPPGERRLDPDERGPGGSRLDGERRRAEGAAGAGQCRAGAGDRAARGCAGDRVPRAARAGAGRARDARCRARALRARP